MMTKETETESLGGRLRRLREEGGFKQREVADALKVTEQAISMYENDRRRPDYEGLVKLAAFLGVSLAYLMTGRTVPGSGVLAEDLSELPAEARGEIASFVAYIKEKYREP